MSKSLSDLLTGVPNAMEVENIIKNNMKNEGCKLFIDDGKENIYIPKSRLDSKISELKQANETITSLNATVSELEKNTGNSEETAKTIKSLQEKVEAYDKQMKDIKITNALELVALENKAKDAKDLKAFVDLTKVAISESGEVTGLKEQVADLVKTKSYLFDAQEEDAPQTGIFGGTGLIGKPSTDNVFGSKTAHAGDFGKLLAQQSKSQSEESKIDSDYFFK